MPCSIRSVERSDRIRWEELFRGYLDFYDTDLPDEGVERVWNWIFDPENDFWCALAIDEDGLALGLAHYQLMHNTLYGSMVCYLADLFIDPSQRGAGIGRSLVDHVLKFAEDENLPTVDWLTDETNYAGRRLYDTYRSKTDYVFYSVPV